MTKPIAARSLLITYRSEPANRPAFRVYLQREERAQLDKLKREGVVESYQILFNPFVTSGTWDAMTVLTFTRYADTRPLEGNRTNGAGRPDAEGPAARKARRHVFGRFVVERRRPGVCRQR